MKLKNWCYATAVLGLIVSVPFSAHADENTQNAQINAPTTNCGVVSVLALAQVMGRTVAVPVREHILQANTAPTATLAQVKNMAAQIGVPMQGVKTTLQSLLQEQKPSIIHLRAPDHFVLMLDGSPQWIRLMDGNDGVLSVMPRAEIERRFDGFALQIVDNNFPNEPRIALQESDYAFGVRGVGQKVEHTFQLANAGQSDLKVNVQGTSCGCTAALLGEGANASEVTLQPGQSVPVKVTVEVQVAGSVQQMVTLATNDPARPLVYLTMRGTAPQNLEVSPQSVNLQLQQGETKDRVVTLVGPPDFAILDCAVDSPLLRVTKQLISKDETRANWKVQVTLADAAVGNVKALLTIKTSHPERPEITVPITANVRGDLQISPNAAFFGFIKQGERQSMELEVTSRSGKPFQITSVEPSSKEGLQIEVPLNRAAQKHTVKVGLVPQTATFIESQLKLRTDSPEEPILIIPVTAFVEASAPGEAEAAGLPRAEDNQNNIIGVAKPLVKVGQRAPNFVVKDTSGKEWKLSDLKGKENVLLTFFPQCFTGGCANHLSSLRDVYPQLQNTDTEVFAVSVDAADGEKGQKAFAAQWKLSFPLIPDTSRSLSQLFGAAQTDKQLAARMSVLIDKAGIVRWIDTDVQVKTHGADVLSKINELGLNK